MKTTRQNRISVPQVLKDSITMSLPSVIDIAVYLHSVAERAVPRSSVLPVRLLDPL